MTKKQIFRNVALERLSSPEQLDQLLNVTTPKGWLALAGVAIILVAMIAWGILGEVPITVNGTGILLKTEGVRNVPAPQSGQITKLYVSKGVTIQAGQPVAQISHSDLMTIETPFSGVVSEIRAGEGEIVEIGDPIFSLVLMQALDEALQTVLYLPAAEAKKITPGMLAQISPSTVRREEFGFMVGTVTSVNELPSTRDGMRRTLGSEEWLSHFAQMVAPVEIRIALTADPNTPSGYRWSSRGPDVTIGNGTPCEVDIILEERTPLSLLIAY